MTNERKALKHNVPDISAIKFKAIKEHSQEMVQHLTKFEQRSIIKRYKFGVLYVKPGQSDENDWFGNGSGNFYEFSMCLSIFSG